jgi:lipopolysaccharide export system permease protein
MPVIQRYLFRLAGVACLASLFGLTGVIWITQALRDFDLLTSKGQSILIFLSVTAMVLPSLVMIIAPVALFAAVVFTLNKLNGDSELISISAAGMSPWQTMRPFAGLTLITAAFVGIMSLWLMPWGFANLRNILMKVRADFLANIVVEGQFTTLDRGFVFHYRERAPGNGLRGIFIQDRRDPERINTYLAEAGYTVESNGQNFLRLEKGSIQRQQQGSKDPIMVVFDTYAIDLAQFTPDLAGAPLKPRERSTLNLLLPDRADVYVQRNLGSLRSELHDRIANPLYALVFGAIAFAAVGRVRTTRQGRGASVIAAVLIALAVRLLGVGAAAIASNYAAAVAAQYLLPLTALAGALWYALGDPLETFRRWTPARRASDLVTAT